MATLKKIRGRRTMEIKKVLGVSFSLARAITKEIVDSEYKLTPQVLSDHKEVVATKEYSCTCCGTWHIWETKKGYLQYKFRTWSYESK